MLIEVCPTAVLDVSRLLTVIPAGADAREEFERLAMWCGWGPVDGGALEVSSRSHNDVDDNAAAAARQFNGDIKSVLWASFDGKDIEAFAGAALVPIGHPLSNGAENRHHVHVAGTYRNEALPGNRAGLGLSHRVVSAPDTEWLVRARFPGLPPHSDAMSALFARVGLQTMATAVHGDDHWRRIAATSRTRVESAVTELLERHRVTLTAIRAL